jgi:hypothetical protein
MHHLLLPLAGGGEGRTKSEAGAWSLIHPCLPHIFPPEPLTSYLLLQIVSPSLYSLPLFSSVDLLVSQVLILLPTHYLVKFLSQKHTPITPCFKPVTSDK